MYFRLRAKSASMFLVGHEVSSCAHLSKPISASASITPGKLIVQFAQAFGTYLDGGRILVCRDTRPSGAMVRAGVMAGLLAAGCEVVDLEICPTPTMQLAVQAFGAQGGISITAGHNPTEWNALKFVRAS